MYCEFANLSLVQLWRLRRVCRDLYEWATAVLRLLPRPIAIGGSRQGKHRYMRCCPVAQTQMLALDLSTLRWTESEPPSVPILPAPRARHTANVSQDDGTLTVAGIFEDYLGDVPVPEEQTPYNRNYHVNIVLRWTPGGEWRAVAPLSTYHAEVMGMTLPDGRTVILGGQNVDEESFATVQSVSADGRSCVTQTPMPRLCVEQSGGEVSRRSAAIGLLPTGQVIVAWGSHNDEGDLDSCRTAAAWNPVADTWSVLPAMSHRRDRPAGCVLS